MSYNQITRTELRCDSCPANLVWHGHASKKHTEDHARRQGWKVTGSAATREHRCPNCR